MKAIRELGQRARWPKKPTPRENDRRDASKRCEHHNDIGHNKEDCIVLRKEVKQLYSARCLDHLLPKGAKSGKEGSEICGLIYSAAKRHVTETKGDKPEFSLRVSRQDLPAISFDKADVPDEAEHHHDALIITFSIGNCLVKKILVDTGSSVNLIMLETLKNMEFSEKDLVHKAIPLAGFSGETKQSLGEIVIPTFAGGMNKQRVYITSPQEELDEVNLDPQFPARIVLVGADYVGNIREQLIEFLRTNMDCFAWSHSDMIGIDPSVITHWLNVDPNFPPVQQKRRKFAPERNEVINQEVDNLLAAGKIREVNYPEWLSNVVVVPKMNNKWRVYVDFTDLNKACPKKTRSPCRTLIPCLKNAGSTYQRLVNKMLKVEIGRTMEVYIDDMVVKSEKAEQHMSHLGYLVTQRGIEASTEQLKASKKFEWTQEHKKAFRELKQYLSTRPLLSKPKQGEPMYLYLSVTEAAVSVVLVREHEGMQKPVYYISKSLLPAETRYTSLEKLILALVTASYKLRPYFESHTISVVSNYPLTTIMRKPELSGIMVKWSVHLSGYDLKFEPRKAIKSQALADVVSDFSPTLQEQAVSEILTLSEAKEEQIPWDQNVEADALATLGAAFTPGAVGTIPFIHVMKPAIRQNEQQNASKAATTQWTYEAGILYTATPQEEIDDWRKPYISWLRDEGVLGRTLSEVLEHTEGTSSNV
ncbi:uncharacterized protein LOC141632151 [Silene latifolia]|uniref:uncharacterized protein LOC141632151 n=1 Tax=Silene latifolia TaxID=37657 RepID=UPI003D76EC7C